MKRSFVFPGQGSQYVGMGKEMADAFTEARDVFAEVDEALKTKLSKIIFEGPIEELSMTENTQPALMATSMAVFRTLEKQAKLDLAKVAAYVAGHSLGEYTALTAAGSLTISDAARLLRTRGKAMQEAVPKGQGGMVVLLGADLDVAKKIAAEAAAGDICQAANDNSPGQVVISGAATAIGRIAAIAQTHGIKRTIPLQVSAPFHSKLMEPAAKVMRDALAAVDVKKPVVPLIANVTAAEVVDPDQIRKLLVEQVTGMVRWRETINYMAEKGVTQQIEIGAGAVLSGLAKRTTDKITQVNVECPQDIEKFLKSI